jgi:hypothetical protein
VVLSNIPKTTVDNDSCSPELLCASAHESSPASTNEPLRLGDEDNRVFGDGVGEMSRWRWGGFVGSRYHTHCVCGTEDFVVWGEDAWGVHFQAGEVAAMGHFQLDEGISNLD